MPRHMSLADRFTVMSGLTPQYEANLGSIAAGCRYTRSIVEGQSLTESSLQLISHAPRLRDERGMSGSNRSSALVAIRSQIGPV